MRYLGFMLWMLTFTGIHAQVPVSVMDRIPLVPYPQTLSYDGEYIAFPSQISVSGLDGGTIKQRQSIHTFRSLFALMPEVTFSCNRSLPYNISFARTPGMKAESYRIDMDSSGIQVVFSSASGAYYAAQTLYQILAFSYFGGELLFSWEEPVEPNAVEKKYIPLLHIEDHPQYQVRGTMIDMGRSVFTKSCIKRLIRIMAHLKMNLLHIHLYDDELCGFRFKHIPLGSENPFALDAKDLKELIRYARSHHIDIMPELESWGHVKSVIYHYPQCYGKPGIYGGASFAIGEKTYDLLEKIYREIVLCLEDTAAVHVGLDEARWAVYADERNRGHTPTTHVGRIYDILMSLGKEYGKAITMHLWADHGGRPIPERITENIVIQPWKYRQSDEKDISQALKKYGGSGKIAVMMGAGVRSVCFDGCFTATRHWCREGVQFPNVLGGTVCIWGTNQLASRLVGVYAGADYLWTPLTPNDRDNDPYNEQLRADILTNMRKWQIVFPDANPDQLALDQGLEVHLGRYVWPPFANKAVTPVVDFDPAEGVEK